MPSVRPKNTTFKSKYICEYALSLTIKSIGKWLSKNPNICVYDILIQKGQDECGMDFWFATIYYQEVFEYQIIDSDLSESES